MSQRDSRGPRDGGGRGGRRGGGDYDRRRERDGPRGDSRARSRSPRRDAPRENNTRTRSPPRGPRRDNDRDERRPPMNPTKPSQQRAPPRDHPSRSTPASTSNGAAPTNGTAPKMETDEDDKKPKALLEDGDEDPEEAAMKKLMGFGKFRSTKNTKVPGNDKNYAVRKEKKTEYRQYMNRTGGFNRPLSPG